MRAIYSIVTYCHLLSWSRQAPEATTKVARGTLEKKFLKSKKVENMAEELSL